VSNLGLLILLYIVIIIILIMMLLSSSSPPPPHHHHHKGVPNWSRWKCEWFVWKHAPWWSLCSAEWS